MTTTEFVKFIAHAYPEYKGRLLFGIGDLARMYTNGNEQKMREHIAKYRIPFYRIGEKGHKLYNLLDVHESVEKTRWRQK